MLNGTWTKENFEKHHQKHPEIYEMFSATGLKTHTTMDLGKLFFNARKPLRDAEIIHEIDGTTKVLHVSASPIFSADGEFTGYRGTGCDVTAQYMELRIQETIRTLKPDWRWETDADNRFVWVSDNFEVITKTRPEDIVGFTREEHCKRFNRYLRHLDEVGAAVKARKSFHDCQYEWLLDDGLVRTFSLTGMPEFDESGEYFGYVGIGRDVTDWRSALTDLAKKSKLVWCWTTDKNHVIDWLQRGPWNYFTP